MAGIERSGFENSNRSMFNNASIILVPPQGAPIELLEQLKKFWGAIGFTNLEITTAVRHDKIIAYTSQLAHVASSAFVKSETALAHKGFSAGSYKDLTRVARLNEVMWAELFLENRENLLRETTELIEALQKYEDALKNNDEEVLMQLLKEGRLRKEQADRNDMK
jgi:prephenate dehydrogenase